MVKDRDSNEFKSALGTSALPTDRNDLRPSALAPEDDPNLREEREMRSLFNNASRIPHGHAQSVAALAAGRPDARTSSLTEKERQRKENNERYMSQEMQRLAEWNAKMVTIAGVQMTNEEAQRARRHFIENEDEYAERAVRRGLIRNGEQAELKRTMRRRCELEDRTGRGVDTAEDRRELAEIKKSRMGRAADEATADIHTSRKIGANADAKRDITRDAAPTSASPLPSARDIFQSTPVAQSAFAQAAQSVADNPEPVLPTPVPPAPPPVSREVKATGLEI